jgi:hypothetical protein
MTAPPAWRHHARGGLTVVQDPAMTPRWRPCRRARSAAFAPHLILPLARIGALLPMLENKIMSAQDPSKLLIVDDLPENLRALDAVIRDEPAPGVPGLSGEEALT